MNKFKLYSGLLLALTVFNLLFNSFFYLVSEMELIRYMINTVFGQVLCAGGAGYLVFSAKKEPKKKQIYTYKENKYTVIRENVLVKDPTTRKWINCTYYTNEEGYLRFCRETSEFYSKFEKL